MHDKTLAELSAMLDSGETSSVELTEHYLSRIGELDKDLNSFITVDNDGALKSAAAADDARAAGNASALTGIPMVHKDIFCTQGCVDHLWLAHA